MIWSDLYPHIQPHVPGCPEAVIQDELRRTAIRFCRETHIWEEELVRLHLTSGFDRYQLSLPEGSEVLSLKSAVQRADSTDPGKEVWPAINVFGLLHFDPPPNPKDGPVHIRAILRPTETSDGLPDRIGLDYEQALVHGTVAALQAYPGQEWSNPGMIVWHSAKYADGVSEAGVRRASGSTERPLRVKPHPHL